MVVAPPVRRWGPAALVAACLFAAAVVPLTGAAAPAGAATVGPVGLDKLLHAVGYALLTAALARGLGDRDGALVAAFVLAVAFGAGLEGVQATLSHRTASVADAVANTLGAAAAVLFRVAARS